MGCALALAGCVRTVAPIPVLGQPAGAFRHGEGFGNVTPSVIYNGGADTGYLGHVVWKSWGGSRSVGSGVAEYVRPGRYPATGTEEPATIVAFKPGICDGKLMYQAIEWYFPQYGQRFNPHQYEDICTGTYVTSATSAGTCLPSRIKVENGPPVGGVMEERALSLTLTNRGPAPCVLDGYARVRLITSAGAVLSLPQVAHSRYVTSAGPRTVLLGIGTTAYILVAKFGCVLGDLQVASQVRLTLPGAGAGTAFTVPILRSIGSVALCKGGPTDPGNVIAVTPVESTLAQSLP